MNWWYILIAVVVGVVGGFFIARSGDNNRRKANDLQEQLNAATTELDDYRERVSRHFARTAELVDALAANSREIYNHLAEGSERLCDSDAVKLGQRDDDRPSLSAAGSSRPAANREQDRISPAKPDDGWYEILPESEEQGNSKKTAKDKVEEPVL
jgi:uncharacterized membrane-anchored protein YhcB (DUF1043 family)